MSGKSNKPYIPSTEKNNLPPVNSPNEEIQLDFIGPITDNHRRFYILLSIDWYSKWPSASFCKYTDGETAVKFLEQYIQLNGIPKTIRTDKATAFTGRLFRDFFEKHYIKLIYGTPYIHTPTGLVERGGKTLKENLLTNIKASERLGKALDLSLDVMRKTPYTKLKKSAFELHYGRKPNTERTNLLNSDNLKNLTKASILAKPDTLLVYSFSGVGGVSDQLPMKTRKNDKGVSNQPFHFLEKKHQKSKSERVYSNKLKIAISETSHTVTTPNGRVIHKKCITKPIYDFNQDCNNNRGTGPRGPDGRFTRSPSKQKRAYVIESDIEPETSPVENNSPTALDQSDNATVKRSTYGRGRPLKLTRDRQNSSPHQSPPGGTSSTGPLTTPTITTANMTDTEIDRAIEDARQANDELCIRDDNGKVFENLTSFPKTGEGNNFENSELDMASNLSSSTELEADIEHGEEKTICRSKRLTKTNPIIRYNNPICHDYRKHSRKVKFRSTEPNGEGDEQPQLNRTTDNRLTSQANNHRDNHESEDQLSVHKQLDHWRSHRNTVEKQHPIGRTVANSERGNEDNTDNFYN